MKRYIWNLVLILALFAFVAPNIANAAAYPNKPIVVVIPFA